MDPEALFVYQVRYRSRPDDGAKTHLGIPDLIRPEWTRTLGSFVSRLGLLFVVDTSGSLMRLTRKGSTPKKSLGPSLDLVVCGLLDDGRLAATR